MNRFIDDNKDNWQRLENLLDMMGIASVRSLSRAEVREFGELYRRTAADLAIARAETRDQKLINYLNSLVIRAHGKIYRAEGKGGNIIWQFFTKDFPRSFRRTWRFTALAFAVFMIFSIVSFILAYSDKKFADQAGVAVAGYMAQSNEKWWLGLNEANQVGSSQILTNNIRVCLLAFAFGAFFGIGTIYILAKNGIHIGGVLGVCYQANTPFANDLATFMVAHGVIELSCIFISAGAGMLIGYAMINPGDLTRTQALKKNGLEATRLAIGCAILLVIAGIIEGFISPSNLPAAAKIAVGVLTGIAMYSYLLFVGRELAESV
jgi:uncharacterized membrane protein SpoIIM required for sporulation